MTSVQFRWNTTGITIAGVTSNTGATATLLDHPLSLCVDSSNALYIVDGFNHRIQKWLPNGSSGTTVAGSSNGTLGFSLSFLNYPTDITLDSNGNMYIVDSGNSRVLYWVVGGTTGVIVAGNGKYISLYETLLILSIIGKPFAPKIYCIVMQAKHS